METIVERRPTQELRVEEILRRSLELYKARFIQFWVPFIILALVNQALMVALGIGFEAPTRAGTFAELLGFFVDLIPKLVFYGIVGWAINTVVSAMVMRYSSDLLEKGQANFREGFDSALTRLVPLLTATVITSILIILGLVCVVVPGIILSIMFSLVAPVIVIEKVGALESLARSRKLVSKRWGKTFATFLLIIIVLAPVSLIANTISRPFGSMGAIIASVITALIQPISPIAIVFLYYSMVAKETQLAAPAPPPPSFLPPQAKKYCTSCGGEMPEDVIYCPRCGQKQVS